jgi:hypothetical protein
LRLRIRRQHLDDLVVDLVVLVGAGAISASRFRIGWAKNQ